LVIMVPAVASGPCDTHAGYHIHIDPPPDFFPSRIIAQGWRLVVVLVRKHIR
jgi:hypothetical protein